MCISSCFVGDTVDLYIRSGAAEQGGGGALGHGAPPTFLKTRNVPFLILNNNNFILCRNVKYTFVALNIQ